MYEVLEHTGQRCFATPFLGGKNPQPGRNIEDVQGIRVHCRPGGTAVPLRHDNQDAPPPDPGERRFHESEFRGEACEISVDAPYSGGQLDYLRVRLRMTAERDRPASLYRAPASRIRDANISPSTGFTLREGWTACCQS
jgi:hypothetical protein